MLDALREVCGLPKRFAREFEGRRVVIVGPAASLVGRGLGAWIDGHDLIVRFNLACPTPERLKPEIGSRTDILYHTLFNKTLGDAVGQRHSHEQIASWRADGVRWLATRQRPHSPRVRRILPLLGSLPIAATDPRLLIYFRQRIGTSVSLATIAIVGALVADAATVDVTGVDWYRSAYYVGYGGFTADQAARGTGCGLWGQSPGSRRDFPHPQAPQLRYLDELREEDPRLVFDDVALNVLESEAAVA